MHENQILFRQSRLGLCHHGQSCNSSMVSCLLCQKSTSNYKECFTFGTYEHQQKQQKQNGNWTEHNSRAVQHPVKKQNVTQRLSQKTVQNVQFFIQSKTGILNVAKFRYPLHKFSETILQIYIECLFTSSYATEAIWVGSRSSLAKLSNRDYSIQIGTSTIKPSTVVRDLGVYLDSELSMKQQVAKVAASCFYHLRRLRQIRRRVGGEVATRLTLAPIMSRLDQPTATQC